MVGLADPTREKKHVVPSLEQAVHVPRRDRHSSELSCRKNSRGQTRQAETHQSESATATKEEFTAPNHNSSCSQSHPADFYSKRHTFLSLHLGSAHLGKESLHAVLLLLFFAFVSLFGSLVLCRRRF